MGSKITLCRDRSPEAMALGGWFVEIKETVMGVPLVHSTDWHRTPHAAVIAGLSLAYRLGLTLGEAKEN